MSEVRYRKCDVCDKILEKNEGRRIWFSIVNNMDICDKCFKKLKQLKDDIENEDRYIEDFFNVENEGYYREQGNDVYAAYVQGADDMLEILMSRRITRD